MPENHRGQSVSRNPAVWRMAVIASISLASGLSIVGAMLAIQQARALTVKLVSQAQLRARQIAATVQHDFERRREALSDLLGEMGCPPQPDRLERELKQTSWVSGIWTFDGEQAVNVANLSGAPLHVLDQIRLRIERLDMAAPLSPGAILGRSVSQSRESVEQSLLALPCRQAGGASRVIAATIDLTILRKLLIDPLLDQDETLELTLTKHASGPWRQPLSVPLQLWSVQPRKAFLEEQRQAVGAQALIYALLAALILGTLLLGIWFLLHAVQRELAAARIKANFVADVSHELKTPLAMIRLFVETLQSGRMDDPDKRQNYYAVILRETDRLTKMIDNVLSFARLDAGRKLYEPRPVEIGPLIERTYRSYAVELDHKGFEHHLSLPEHLPAVRADPGAVEQIMLNLMSNAVKYSADDRYLAIEVQPDVRRDRQGVLISVHDRGIGISPEERARIFDGFYRASDERVRDVAGVGLGLSVVKQIVNMHEGCVEVESRLVKGTTFRVFLPAADQARPKHR